MRPIAISRHALSETLSAELEAALALFAAIDPSAALQMKEIWLRARAGDERRASEQRGAARRAHIAATEAERRTAYAPVQAANDAVQRAKANLDAGYEAMRQAARERGHTVLPGEFRIGELQADLKAAKKAASLALSVYRGRAPT